MLTNFFLRIYTSSYAYVICCAGVGILGLVYLERWLGRAWWRRPMTGAALAAWAWVVLYATVLSRDAVAEAGLSMVPLHSYRAVLEGADPEILRSSVMNVMLFFPAGALWCSLLPEKCPGRLGVLSAVLLFACFSAGIEYLQYARVLGQAEVDDILHNALGAGAGYGCMLRARRFSLGQ